MVRERVQDFGKRRTKKIVSGKIPAYWHNEEIHLDDCLLEKAKTVKLKELLRRERNGA